MLEDLGFEPITEETPQPTTEPTPQNEQGGGEQPQPTTEVLSLNDEQVPTVEQPAQEQPNQQPQTIDKNAILNELFGADVDTIRAWKEEREQLKAEVEKPRYQSKFGEYIDNLVSKYGDPKQQAEVFKKTIDVLTTDVDGLDDATAIAFTMKQQFPSFSDEDIKTAIEGKYNQSEYVTEEQRKFGAVQMKMDAQSAKLSIKQMQADALKDVPNKAAELKQIDQEKIKLEWKPASQEIANSIKNFEFEVDKGKKMKFDVPETDRAWLAQVAESISTSMGKAPDQNTKAEIKKLVEMTYVYQNAPKLISNAFKRGLSQANSEWSKQVHNPSGLKNTQGGLEIGGGKKGAGEYEIDDIVRFIEGR